MAFNSIASAETCRKSAPFRVGYSPLSQALSAPLQSGIRFLRLSSTPSVIPLPCGRDTALRRDEWGLPCCPMWRREWGGCVLYPAGHGATVVDGSNPRADPHAILAPACQHFWPVLDDGP